MEIRLIFASLLFRACTSGGLMDQTVYPARLVHRFSDEARVHLGAGVLRNGAEVAGRVEFWPQWRSLEYYRRLLSSDVRRQTLMLNPKYPVLYPVEGSATLSLGNDFGWLHYIWVDIGTPRLPFLVALDAGSDLFWVPCDCVQCAPLSASYYSSLDKDLNQYNPSGSSTSKPLPCSHQLCKLTSDCSDHSRQCPYTINYYSDNTSTSGFLFQDVLHLVPGHFDASNKPLRAPVIIGCGSKQTGGYLDGVAPDGLLGLGLGEIAVPSFLASAGYIHNSFSLCFGEDDSGTLFFGDLGIAEQQTTPFLSFDGKNSTYVVGVDACCIESSCLNNTNLEMLVDSGTSFTFLPSQIYEIVVKEFDRQVNVTKSSFQGYPWEYCYRSGSQGLPKIPSLTLKLAASEGFLVDNPAFVIYGAQGAIGFCLAIQSSDGNIGTIGQNFMIGYKIVFDRETFKMGWSPSNCHVDLNSSDTSNSSSLPTDQHSAPNGHAVAPAVAGRTPSSSATTSLSYRTKLFLLLLITHIA